MFKLIAANEIVKFPEDSSWIGLQFGIPHNVTLVYPNGEVLGFEYQPGCWWRADERPRLAKADPCPENAVDECSVTYNNTFHGQWEDGDRYDDAESADFWASKEPLDDYKSNCMGIRVDVDELNQAYCERGPNGKPDTRRHCAQILPADEKQIENKYMKPAAGKWTLYWCWMKTRAYICERPAARYDASDDSTASANASEHAGTSASVTARSCVSQIKACTSRARGRIDETERDIKAARTGNGEVIDTMALGGPDAGSMWLGGSASLSGLAQSAIDYGRSIAKLSTEECFHVSRDLRRQLQDLSKKLEESYERVNADLDANNLPSVKAIREAAFRDSYRDYTREIRIPLVLTYEFAVKTLREEDNESVQSYRSYLTNYCERPTPEDTIMKMLTYFVWPSPEGETSSEGVESNILLDLVEYELNSTTKVQLLMAEVDAVTRLALTSLGVCAQLNNVTERVLNASSTKAMQALSEVSDAFQRALQNDTPAVPIMKKTAAYIIDKFKEDLSAKGWSGREGLYKRIVNTSIDALKNHTRNRYVLNALAFLPDNRTDQQCQFFTKNNFVDVSYRYLNYLILHTSERGKRFHDIAWNQLMKTEAAKDAVLNRVFTKSSESLCERLAAALAANEVDARDFGGVAAVKCGYEFVWYELGYTYFYAAYSSTDYKWQKKGGAYDAMCGQIFFFP